MCEAMDMYEWNLNHYRVQTLVTIHLRLNIDIKDCTSNNSYIFDKFFALNHFSSARTLSLYITFFSFYFTSAADFSNLSPCSPVIYHGAIYKNPSLLTKHRKLVLCTAPLYRNAEKPLPSRIQNPQYSCSDTNFPRSAPTFSEKSILSHTSANVFLQISYPLKGSSYVLFCFMSLYLHAHSYTAAQL